MYHYKREGVQEREIICFCEDEDEVSRDSSAPRKVLFWDSRSGCSPIHGKCRFYRESGMEVSINAVFHYCNETSQQMHFFHGTDRDLRGWDYRGREVVLELAVGNQEFGSDEELHEFMNRLGEEPEGVCFLDLMD